VHVYHQKGRAKEYQGPGIAVDWLDIEGPIHEAWPPPSHRHLFGELPLRQVTPPQRIVGPLLPAPPRTPPVTDRRRDSTFPNGLHEHGKVEGVWSVTSGDPTADAKQLLQTFLT